MSFTKVVTYLLINATLIITTPIMYGREKIVVNQGDDFEMVFHHTNTIFIIKDDIDLGNNRVIIGEGCSLVFRGGSLSNGTLVGNNTHVKANNYEIFKRGYTRFRAYFGPASKESSPPSLIKEYHNCLFIEGTWKNRSCKPKWTGLLNDSDEDIMLSLRNFVTLHSINAKVTIPTIKAHGYDRILIPRGHVIDFNHSTISYPDNLDIWMDPAIPLPAGSRPSPLESGYGLITVNSNTTITNLSLDGKSNYRQNEKERLGVSCMISVGNSKNIRFENVSLSNVLGPGIIADEKAENITFKKCVFKNIGEHILYSRQYLGFCHFEECLFDTWDSERLSVFRNGLNYVYKHVPHTESEDASFDCLYGFDLCFTDCTFINPKRINSQNRTLGGFLTGNFPVVIKVLNCRFFGVSPVINPVSGSRITDLSKKPFKMIVRGCDGAPHVYPSQATYNIITEYYDCVNIPFRTVYAKRYENCKLSLDFYEDSIENVSSVFESEFKEPLVIKNCEFIDEGRNVTVNHPVIHRPICFVNCRFSSKNKSKSGSSIVSIKAVSLPKVSFQSCDINLPGYRLIGGDKMVETLVVQDCHFESIDVNLTIKVAKIISDNNVFSPKAALTQDRVEM